MHRDSLQVIGAVLGMVGATLIATGLNVYVGFWHFLGSSVVLTLWSIRWRMRWIMYMQLVFTVINMWGIYHWSHHS